MISTLSHSDPGLAFRLVRSYSGSDPIKLHYIFGSREPSASGVSFLRSQLPDTNSHEEQLFFGDGSGRYPRGVSLEMVGGQQV